MKLTKYRTVVWNVRLYLPPVSIWGGRRVVCSWERQYNNHENRYIIYWNVKTKNVDTPKTSTYTGTRNDSATDRTVLHFAYTRMCVVLALGVRSIDHMESVQTVGSYTDLDLSHVYTHANIVYASIRAVGFVS